MNFVNSVFNVYLSVEVCKVVLVDYSFFQVADLCCMLVLFWWKIEIFGLFLFECGFFSMLKDSVECVLKKGYFKMLDCKCFGDWICRKRILLVCRLNDVLVIVCCGVIYVGYVRVCDVLMDGFECCGFVAVCWLRVGSWVCWSVFDFGCLWFGGICLIFVCRCLILGSVSFCCCGFLVEVEVLFSDCCCVFWIWYSWLCGFWGSCWS